MNLRSGLLLLVTLISVLHSSGGAAVAICAPLVALEGSPQFTSFYSIQLVRDGNGDYTVNVYDRSYDELAHARIVVTDCDTDEVILDLSFDSTIGNFDNPGSVSVPVVIDALNFSVALTSGEFSVSRQYFGDELFSFAGVGNGGNPEDTTVRGYSAEPPVSAQVSTWGIMKLRYR